MNGARRLLFLLSLAAVALALAGCGNSLRSRRASSRACASWRLSADKPYAAPGDTVNMNVLA